MSSHTSVVVIIMTAINAALMAIWEYIKGGASDV